VARGPITEGVTRVERRVYRLAQGTFLGSQQNADLAAERRDGA